MDPVYIVAIVILSVYVVCLVICAFIIYKRKSREYDERQELEAALRNPPKMEYDFAVYDEATEKLMARQGDREGQLTIDDIMGGSSFSAEVMSRIESDGLDEITGNYVPNDF